MLALCHQLPPKYPCILVASNAASSFKLLHVSQSHTVLGSPTVLYKYFVQNFRTLSMKFCSKNLNFEMWKLCKVGNWVLFSLGLQRILVSLEYSFDCRYSNAEVWIRVLGPGHMRMRSRLAPFSCSCQRHCHWHWIEADCWIHDDQEKANKPSVGFLRASGDYWCGREEGQEGRLFAVWRNAVNLHRWYDQPS